MKKRMFSLFLVLTLCPDLLPVVAWAAGETILSNITLVGIALESGRSYAATVDGTTKKIGEPAEANYLTYDNDVLIVIGTVETTRGSASLLFYSDILTLAEDGDLTVAVSDSNSAVSGSPQSILTTVEGFSGSITLGSVNTSVVQNAVPDLTAGGDTLISSAKNSIVSVPQGPVMFVGKTVTTRGIDEITEASSVNVSAVTTPKLNVTVEDGVTITGSSAVPLIVDDNGDECAVTSNAGRDAEIVNKDGMAVSSPLAVTETHNVTIEGDGISPFYSASDVHYIDASGAVKMESNGIVCSGNDANGLTITGAETVDIAGESTPAPVVTDMTLNECGAMIVIRLQCSDTTAPIMSTVTPDIPVPLHNGSNSIEPQFLWSGEYYQKAAVDDVYMELSFEAAACYEVGDGYVMFSKTGDGARTGTANAVLLNAGSTASIVGNPAEVKAVGENSLSEIQSLDEVSTKVSSTGNGILYTFSDGNAEPETADGVAFRGPVHVTTTEVPQEQEKPSMSMNLIAYGTSDLPPIIWESDQDLSSFVVGIVSSREAIVAIRSIVSEGATLTIPKEVPLKIEKSEEISCLTNHGILINNSIVPLSDVTPAGTKGLRSTGSGLIQVSSDMSIAYYTNEGMEFGNHKVENLDLSSANVDQDDLKIDGYHWGNADRTLILNGLVLIGALTLSGANGGEIRIVMSKEGFINSVPVSGSYRLTVHITGSIPLTVQGINSDISLTVAQGTALNAMERINIGSLGNADSTITTNDMLMVKDDNGIRCGQMATGTGDTVDISDVCGVAVFGVNGSSGTEYKGVFRIADSGIFTADCTDYNVVVFIGGAMVTKENAEAYLVLPDNYLPAGHSIRVTTGGSGGDTYYAVTAMQKDADLTLISEHITSAGGKMELKYQPTPILDSNPIPDSDPMPDGDSGDSEPSYSTFLTKVKGGTPAVRYEYAPKGDTVTVTIALGAGYELDALTVGDKNDKELVLMDKGDGKYAFPIPGSQVTMIVKFKQIDTGTENLFIDIPKNGYSYDAVLWIVEEGITSDTSDTTLSLSVSCTRAQMAISLRRVSGFPRASVTNPSTGMSTDIYYYGTVLWAMEQGIIGGTNDGRFSLDASYIRARMATFSQWTAGSPVPASNVPTFTDMSKGSWYAGAVQRTYKQNITNDTSDGKFSPDATCTRAQTVQMLKALNQRSHVTKWRDKWWYTEQVKTDLLSPAWQQNESQNL